MMKYQVYRREAVIKVRGGKDIPSEELVRRVQERLDIYMALQMEREKYVGGGWWHVRVTDARIGEVEASSEDEAIAKMSRITGLRPEDLYAQAAN
ncbi:hypothetical protein MYX07_01280 [Patescibacteria group bacterium AH-259-L07]|nr:hypothetical protein [Patescibacteria group bacterium AH-259-L07]